MIATRAAGVAAVALAVLLAGSFAPAQSQTAPYLVLAGATPDPNATVCPGEAAANPALAFSPRIALTPASVANFRAHNPSGNGVFFVTLRGDGVSGALIPPTLDIDAAMRQAIAAFAQTVTLKPPLAGCAHFSKMEIARFRVSDGEVDLQSIPLPPNGLPSTIPLAAVAAAQSAPVFVGPTPDPAATVCPGETAPHALAAPKRIDISPESAAYVREHDHREGGIVMVLLRLDGKAAVSFPPAQDLDPALHDAIVDYANHLLVQPPIPGCARPAAVLTVQFSLDGTANVRQAR